MGVDGQCQIDMQHIEVAYPEVLIGFFVCNHTLPTLELEFCRMASDRGNDANSSVPVVEESRLWGKLIGMLVREYCQCLPLCIIEWRSLWNIFKSNLICEGQVTLINVRSRAVNTSNYVLQPICCGSLVNNMFVLSSPIFENDVHT
jgi:hypothetical protein